MKIFKAGNKKLPKTKENGMLLSFEVDRSMANHPKSTLAYMISQRNRPLWSTAKELCRIREVRGPLPKCRDYKIDDFHFSPDPFSGTFYLGFGVWSPKPGVLVMDRVEIDN